MKGQIDMRETAEQIAQDKRDGSILWCYFADSPSKRPRRFVITRGSGHEVSVSEEHVFEMLCGIRNGNSLYDELWQTNGNPDELLHYLFELDFIDPAPARNLGIELIRVIKNHIGPLTDDELMSLFGAVRPKLRVRPLDSAWKPPDEGDFSQF